MAFACWAVSLTMIVPAMKGVPKANVSSLVKWTMTVSSDMSACPESVPWAAKRPPIVQPLNHVWATNVQTHVRKNHVDPMPNVRLWTKEPNVHVWWDFCPIPQLLLGAPVNPHLVSLTINVRKASNAMPNFADLFVTATMPACPTNCVLTTFAKRFARVTMIAVATKFAKVSSVFQDADPMLIVL